MARILGIDYGRRRIGISVTDPLRLIATPLTTVDSEKILPFLSDYMAKEEVDLIVVGLPSSLKNQESPMVNLVHRFVRFLRRYFPNIEITLHDERYTSLMASRSLLEMGIPKKKRGKKGALDAISATLMLRSFLEQRSYQEENIEGSTSKT